jgi:hypothetical protein
MTFRNGGPPCPKPPRVRELIELVGADEPLSNLATTDLIDALDWLATSLENRALYHKKQNIKNNVLRKLANEYGLLDQANIITDETLHHLVSNQQPDLDVFNTTTPGDGDDDPTT